MDGSFYLLEQMAAILHYICAHLYLIQMLWKLNVKSWHQAMGTKLQFIKRMIIFILRKNGVETLKYIRLTIHYM